MKIIRLFLVMATMGLFTLPVNAWNTAAHVVKWVQYEGNGTILFTLYDDGNSGDDFHCNAAGRVRLRIEPCKATDVQCLAAANRMASALMAAKISGETVHVQNNDCIVTQVAIGG